MELQSDYEQLCEQYLLGELSESEQAEFEEAYFRDDSLFERFLAVKEDLLDAYARDDLTGERLERFEQYYLASEARRQRVEETRELIRMASAASDDTVTAQAGLSQKSMSERTSWWQLFKRSHPVAWRIGLVTAVLVIIAGGWIVVRQIQSDAARRSAEERARSTSQPPEQNGANVNRPQPAPTSGHNIGGERANSSPSSSASVVPEIPTMPPRPTAAQIASLTLLPLSTRETGSANTLTVSQGQRAVRLNLVFGDGAYDTYEVSVRTVDGQQVISRGGLKAGSTETGKAVSITFDSSLLSRQDYIATLRGRMKNAKPETIGEYYFRVQHTAPQRAATPPKQ